MTSAGPLSVTVLGSGTSVGIPTIGCDCKVCRSADPRDRRLRPSVLVRYNGKQVLIDAGPDFRYQALRAGVRRIDAVLFTHGHADHILGLDDLRPINFLQQGAIPIYAAAGTMAIIERVFNYVFFSGPTESSRPKLDRHIFDGSAFPLFGAEVLPIPVHHGRGPCHGFRIGRFAYLTDHSDIPDSSLALLAGLDVLFLDALRYKPHATHSTVHRSLSYVARLQPRAAYFTHIGHDLLHARAESLLPAGVHLAYDGLEIEVAA